MCQSPETVQCSLFTPDAQVARREGFLKRFAREEDGVLLIFGVYVFLLVLMIGGIGIDLMRFERDRTQLQYTLDRAVLAAADLDQTLDPEAVVADYFQKAGMSDYLATVTVSEGLSYRTVSAEATAVVETQFMHMTGLDALNAPAAGTAEERIDGVEISLVLDVSGSMNSNSRLTNLKVAAKEFVDEMADNSEDGKLSISIIPYATQVSIPAYFMEELTVTDEHTYSNCVNFESGDFQTATLDPLTLMERTMHFDPWTSDPWDDHDGREDGILVGRPICEDDPARQSMIMQKDRTKLKNFIQNLWADGNTSIDIGMKWGTALLDPSIQPVIDQLIIDDEVDAGFGDRPHFYDSGDALKVIVLMTDGKNTSQYYIDDDFRAGDSNIFWNEDEEYYSVYDDASGRYYWPEDDEWHDHAYGNQEATTVCKKYRKNGKCKKWKTIPPEPGEAFAIPYPDLWAYTALERHVEYFYEPWMNDNQAWDDWYYDVRRSVGSSTKNTRTSQICDAAKDKQIIVFAIGFEAPDDGNAVLRDCASSDSHFFDVDGLEISDAFASIASSIRKLRLTQ